jgi:hypothetical protein
MSNHANNLNPSELVSMSPDLLPEACHRLAHVLLCGDRPTENDPFSRMAESILSTLLMEGVLHNSRANIDKTRAGTPEGRRQE